MEPGQERSCLVPASIELGYAMDPIFLVSIAVQESTYIADAGGPATGLVQIIWQNFP